MTERTLRLCAAGNTESPFSGLKPERWMDEGLCNQTDPEIFFPNPGGSSREAKKVCMGCPIQQRCLDWAIERQERFGIWGGFSERERRRIEAGLPPNRPRRADPIVAKLVDPSRTDCDAHGYNRYRRGCRCKVCTAGNTEYQRLYQQSVGNPRKHCASCDKELHGKGRHRYCSTFCKSVAYSARRRKDAA